MTQAASVTSLADWATGEGKEVSSTINEYPKEWLGMVWKLLILMLQVGVVTTARLTHATPGAMYSHSPMRKWEADVNLPTDSVGCTDIATQVCFNSLSASAGVTSTFSSAVDRVDGGGEGGCGTWRWSKELPDS